jgi:hypothetical protein
MALEQLRYRGQRRYQGRWPINLFQHQVLDLGGRVPKGLQVDVHPLSHNLLQPKLSGGLLQSVGQSTPPRRRCHDQVIGPCTGSFKARPPLLLLLEFSNQLVHNFHLEGFIGRAPERELRGRGHPPLECPPIGDFSPLGGRTTTRHSLEPGFVEGCHTPKSQILECD